MMAQLSMMRDFLAPMMVFRKDGITYVPHFFKPNVYVSPGYALNHFNEYTPEQLDNEGFERSVEMLSRSKFVVQHRSTIEPEIAALLRKQA